MSFFGSIYTFKRSNSRIFTRASLLGKKMSLTPEIIDESPHAKPDTITESRNLVRRYKQLARDTSNRIRMVKDNSCVAALILFLDDEDTIVVQTSLETLSLLAQNPTNKKVMKSQEKLVFSLENIVLSHISDHETQVMAQQVLDSINFCARASLRRRSSYGGGSFISQNSRARTVVLQITSLDETNKALVEKQLLEMKGIISFTFNMSQQRCKVRIVESITGKELCRYLYRNLSLYAQQVVKNEEGEILLSYIHDSCDATGKDLPDYIPEDDMTHPIISGKAVARMDDESQPNFWGRLGTFISNTLYW
ncbi:Armadillo repeat-containing protein 1 [Oopsacas minuta]|uniref:Armadillo repeat-containing protein 1 n=1 Tax=Oopsacas minuta TaxID=111878 RepID=A0AAV7JP42_9METZ|nr:Armadillo repeat-containing protein 1 [Oopsacas minuta]